MIIPSLCSCMATLRLCTWLQELELILDWYVRMEALNLDWLRKNQRTIRAELYGWSCNYFMDAYSMCTVAYNFALFARSFHFNVPL